MTTEAEIKDVIYLRKLILIHLTPHTFPSNQHLSCDDRLKDTRGNYQNFMCYAVSHSCAHRAGITIVPVVPWEPSPRPPGGSRPTANFYHAVLTST